MKDLINFDNMLGRFEQYGKVRMTGAEVSIQARPAKGLTARLAYNRLHTGNRSRVTLENTWHEALGYRPDELPYRSQHRVDLESPSVSRTGFA